MIAQHFIFESHKPEVLMGAFNEAAALWKNMAPKKFRFGVYRGLKSIICHFLQDAITWNKWESEWMVLRQTKIF